jgi:iron complex transport system ATP-binding protein
MSASSLTFADVRFAYPGCPVFDGLTLDVAAGEFTAVLGPNGSGKTTLLRLATRVVRPAGGRVLVGGRDLRKLGRGEIAREVAVVPQEEHALFSFTVEQAVLMGRYAWHGAFGFEREEDRRIARECLRAVDAEDLAGRDLRDLSGGERQRVLLARALAQRAGLLVLDEPISHLDLKHRVGILRLLRGLRETEGITVVVISHDVNLAARFADRLLFLGEGGLIAEGRPREVLEPGVLERVYGTKVTVRRVPGVDAPQVFPD